MINYCRESYILVANLLHTKYPNKHKIITQPVTTLLLKICLVFRDDDVVR